MNIVEHLRELRRREYDCTVAIVEALVEGLGYSNAAASRRLRATRCAQKFPVVLELLRSRRVTLSSLEAIAPVLDALASEQALLDRIDGKSQAEVQRGVAAERPQGQRRESVRREFVKPEAKKGREVARAGASVEGGNAAQAGEAVQADKPPSPATRPSPANPAGPACQSTPQNAHATSPEPRAMPCSCAMANAAPS